MATIDSQATQRYYRSINTNLSMTYVDTPDGEEFVTDFRSPLNTEVDAEPMTLAYAVSCALVHLVLHKREMDRIDEQLMDADCGDWFHPDEIDELRARWSFGRRALMEWRHMLCDFAENHLIDDAEINKWEAYEAISTVERISDTSEPWVINVVVAAAVRSLGLRAKGLYLLSTEEGC